MGWTITADKFLTTGQIHSLIDHCLKQRDLEIARRNNTQSIRDYYSIRTLLETGLRVSEFCALKNADFTGLKLIVRRGKGGKARTVLLTRPTANMLKEWLAVKSSLGIDPSPNSPLFPSRYRTSYSTRGVQKRVKVLFKAVGLPSHLSVHSLRHTYCSLLIATGKVGIGTVRDNMGHHSIVVTDLYTHAVGSIENVELLPKSSSQNSDLSEPQTYQRSKKANDVVNTFLRNANLKRGVR